MNYHRRIKLEKARKKASWSSTNKPNDYGNPGKKMAGNPLPYGKLPGNGQEKFWSQSELYLVEACFCPRCTEYLKSRGIEAEITYEPVKMVVELESDERFLEYEFRERGSTQVPRAKGIWKILRALMADKKGPWTNKQFMMNGKLIRPPVHWSLEKFDHLTGTEQALASPINAMNIKTEKSLFDDKLDFESRAQLNREFEKRFES